MVNERSGEDTVVIAVILQWDVRFYFDHPYTWVCPSMIVVLHCQPLNLLMDSLFGPRTAGVSGRESLWGPTVS